MAPDRRGSHRRTGSSAARRLAAEAGAKRLVLTHFSPRYASVEEFLDEAGSIHPDVIAAQDGDRIALPRRSR